MGGNGSEPCIKVESQGSPHPISIRAAGEGEGRGQAETSCFQQGRAAIPSGILKP